VDRLPPETQQDLLALLRMPELRPARLGILVEALGTRSAKARAEDRLADRSDQTDQTDQTDSEPAKDRLALQPYSRGSPRAVLFERDPDKAFLPASNMKLLTAAATLAALGGDFRYETQVLAEAKIDAPGRLAGDLFLRGAGDPSLDYDDLADLAGQLAQRGLKQVAGRVIGDDSAFPDAPLGEGWSWDDLPWYYAMEVSALSLGRNQVDVIVRPADKAGQPALVEVKPANDYFQVVNRAVTTEAGTKPSIRYDRPLGHPAMEVSGNVPCGAEPISQGCSVPHPALYAATVFTAKLRERGIEVLGEPQTGPTPPPAPPLRGEGGKRPVSLAAVQSAPLRELLPRLNKHSDNLYAELFLRTLGQRHAGTGTARHGGEGIVAFLQGLGLDTTALRVADGSGLSRFNLVSPRLLVGVLRALAQHPEAEAFYASLPIAGVDGTLAGRMKGTPAAGNVHAKTGYLSQVSSLSGYVTTADGHILAVSILTNNFTCPTSKVRGLQDQVCTLLAGCRLGK
jgi:D-alanyl-D-alanine carboxypeptidase/D-alanyl-D-alanine-endopeptidase (penicillin-binding protein 4)